MNLQQFKKTLLKDEKFKKEYCIPDAREIATIRQIEGLTQKELAKRCGTQQSAISRLENHSERVAFKFIGKIAYALGYRAKLEFTKLEK